MPKSAVTYLRSCPKQIFLAGTTLLLALLPVAGALGAEPQPNLQRSERLDVGRLGKVSEDERAVLRIEWRVGLNGVEEAHRVQEIMDNLRRMEGTMAAISVLVRNMPARPPVAEAPAPVADASNGPDWRIMAANVAALALVAIWWFGRRRSAQTRLAGAAARDAVEPVGVESGAPLPAPSVPLPIGMPPADAAESTPPPLPTRLEPPVPKMVATSAAAEILAPSAPAIPPPSQASASVAGTAASAPGNPGPQVVDFSLEEAPPQVAAAAAATSSPPPAPAAKTPAASGGNTPERAVEPTLQLAEIMLSMGLEQGAAQALVDYTEANPRHALYHWLKLLGIYRKRGLHQEFMAAAEKLRKNFNIQAEYLLKPQVGKMPTLEDFTRVAEHVQKIWGHPEECIDYLQHLLEDNRGGERAGFPQSVAEEILLLVEILKDKSGAA